jgi:hypothetical protein
VVMMNPFKAWSEEPRSDCPADENRLFLKGKFA